MEGDTVAGPKGWYSRGYLPHFDSPGTIQFITYRLEDACPRALHDRWLAELQQLPPDRQQSEYRKRLLVYLDKGAGSCLLKEPELASIVENAFLHFDGERYRLLSWVVMPNHIHLMAEFHEGIRLDQVIHSWKSYTSNQINSVLGRSGTLWHREFFDRYVRDYDHFQTLLQYIHQNPVKAKLCKEPSEWRWSSAYHGRLEAGGPG